MDEVSNLPFAGTTEIYWHVQSHWR